MRVNSAASYHDDEGAEIAFRPATARLWKSDPAGWTKVAAAEVSPFIYSRYYLGERDAGARFRRPVPDLTPINRYADPDFLARLEAANGGTGYFDEGWIIKERTSEHIILEKQGLCLTATPADLRCDGDMRIGEPARVRLPNHRRHMSRGHYTAIPEQGLPSGAVGLARLYLHVGAHSAPALLAALTAVTSPFERPYVAKLLNNPADYWRPDSCVVVFARDDLAFLLARLSPMLAQAEINVHDPVPAFTRRISPGIAVAEEPADTRRPGVSFGQHRSLLAAEGLAAAFMAGDGDRALQYLEQSFRDNGIDPERPYLNPGSHELDVGTA